MRRTEGTLVDRFKARLDAHGADCPCANFSLETVVALLAELGREMLAARAEEQQSLFHAEAPTQIDAVGTTGGKATTATRQP